MAQKKMSLIEKDNGIDLMLEKDAGNSIRILMGKEENCKKNWEQLKKLCDKALIQIK